MMYAGLPGQRRVNRLQSLRDSLKLYFVMCRFAVLSFATAAIDNVAFLAAYALLAKIAPSQAVGRAVAVLFNYGVARRAVFFSEARHSEALPRYLLLVIVNGFVSYALLTFLHKRFEWNVVICKMVAETLLFCANFAVQREFVFARRRPQLGSEAAEWE